MGGVDAKEEYCRECLYFNCGPDNEYDFCDEKEYVVSHNSYCPKYKNLVDKYVRRYEER